MEDSRPYNEGDSVWYWKRDPNKVRGGLWIKTRVTSKANHHGQVGINVAGGHELVNRTKLKRCPDLWHDVVIPGLEHDLVDEDGRPIGGRDGNPEVPPEGDEDDAANTHHYHPHSGALWSRFSKPTPVQCLP